MAGVSDVISRLSVWLGLDTAAFERGADISEKRLKKMEREFERSGKKIQELGKKLTLAISAPVAAAGVAVVKMAGDFEQSMIKLGISSQASADQLKQMSDLALKLGKDTIFGASDAANAMDELAKSGLSATDILNGAAEATVYLATAAGSELSPAANAITDSMQQFGLTTAQLPEAINQITGAVNQSKLDFEDFALAIGQSGGVAGGLGVEFTDFNTVLAATSSLFASGSDAGTSFKTFLTSLAGNSKQAKDAIAAFGLQFYDANGGLRSMAEIAEELRKKLGGLNEQAKTEVLKTIFGTDAMRTAIGLMNQGAEGLDRIAAAIKNTDAAAQAAERMKGFYGQLENLKGAIETLAIRVGQSGVLEAITALVTKIGDFIDFLSEASPGVLQFAAVLGTLAAVVGPVVLAFGVLKSTFAPLWVAISIGLPSLTLLKLELVALATVGGPAAVAMRVLAVAVRGLLIATGVGAAIAVLAGAIYLFTVRSREAVPATRAYSQALNTAEQTAKDAQTASQRLAGAMGEERKAALQAAQAQRTLTEARLRAAQARLLQAEFDAKATAAEAKRTAALASGGGPGEGVQGRISSSQHRFNEARRAAVLADANAKAAEQSVLTLMKARHDLDQSIKAATAPIDLPKVTGSPIGDDGGNKKSKKGSKDRTDENAARAAQDRYNLEIEQLRAQAALTSDVDDRADFERQILAKEREARYADLAAAVKSGELTKEQAAAQREILRTLYGRSDAERQGEEIVVEGQKSLYEQKLEQDRRLQLFEDANDLAEARNRAESDALRNQFDLADTDAERKRIALQILDAEDAYLRSKLQAVIANHDLAKAVRDQAQIELDALNTSYADRRDIVSRQNETEAERFSRDLNKTPEQINEAIDAIKIDGLQSLNNQIADAIVNFKSMGNVFANVVKQMIADLIRLQLQKSLIAPLANLLNLGSMFGGSSLPGTAGGMDLRGFSNFKIPGNANGTSYWPGGWSMVGERGPELVDLPRGARVTPNNDLRGMMGGGIAQIIPSPYFDVVVDGRVMRAAPGIAQAGAQGGVARIQYAQSRRWR